MKIVYNNQYGGFSLSMVAAQRLLELGAKEMQEAIDECKQYSSRSIYLPKSIKRHDLRLIQVVEELADKASGGSAKLEIYKSSDDMYKISEYDDKETVTTMLSANSDWIFIK